MLWYSMENPSSRAFFQKRIGPIFLKEEIEKQIKILQMKRKWNVKKYVPFTFHLYCVILCLVFRISIFLCDNTS